MYRHHTTSFDDCILFRYHHHSHHAIRAHQDLVLHPSHSVGSRNIRSRQNPASSHSPSQHSLLAREAAARFCARSAMKADLSTPQSSHLELTRWTNSDGEKGREVFLPLVSSSWVSVMPAVGVAELRPDSLRVGSTSVVLVEWSQLMTIKSRRLAHSAYLGYKCFFFRLWTPTCSLGIQLPRPLFSKASCLIHIGSVHNMHHARHIFSVD